MKSSASTSPRGGSVFLLHARTFMYCGYRGIPLESGHVAPRGSPLHSRRRDSDRLVRAAKGDAGAAEKAQKRVLELQNQLDAAEKKLKWPTLVAEARELQDELKQLAEDHGNSSHQQKTDDWSDALDSIIEKNQTDRLTRKVEEGRSIYAQILFSLPAYWVGNFQRMERDRGQFSDSDAAERLFERGREYLQKNNIEGLTDVVRKLWNLMPREVAEKAQRGIGATIH